MTAVALTLKVLVNDGPAWTIAHSDTVEAYDVIDITVDENTTDKVVQIQPATAANVNLLVIQSNLYGSQITYKASDGATDSAAIPLQGPQFYGKGVASLFGRDPLSLKFSNSNTTSDKKARIQILVGRDATP